jgi:hypothetical protein
MSIAETLFNDWYTKELAEIRRVKRGVSPSELPSEVWARLDVPTKTLLTLFFNSVQGHHDPVSYIERQMIAYIQGTLPSDLWKNPDVRLLLEKFLGCESGE